MAVTVLERTYRFCASHRYWRDEWSAEKNHATFGRCALPHGHGHNYRFTLRVEGEPDAKTGMIADLGPLDALVHREVLDRFDHRNINVDVPHFRDVMPTTENLARYLFALLAPRIATGRLVSVTMEEDEFLSATCSSDR
jgi:6-pyruvoyltetrahydropterin/6-carboxytetrahydropterin synthase